MVGIGAGPYRSPGTARGGPIVETMTAGPHDEGMHEVEREAMFFAVLRERTRPIEAPRPVEAVEATALPPGGDRLQEADREIEAWLEEAEEEGNRILEQAREEATRLRMEAHEQAEGLRQAAERAAAEATRERERVLREAEVAAARTEAEAAAQAAQALRDAEDAAARRRREAAEEAAALLAETRETAERRLQSAEREADWVRVQAEGDARAIHAHAAATVRALQSDVGALHEQLAALVSQASALLPALDAANRSLANGPDALAAPAGGELELGHDRGIGELTTGSVEAPAEPGDEEEHGEARGGVEEQAESAPVFDAVVAPDPAVEAVPGEQSAPRGRRPLGRLFRRI